MFIKHQNRWFLPVKAFFCKVHSPDVSHTAFRSKITYGQERKKNSSTNFVNVAPQNVNSRRRSSYGDSLFWRNKENVQREKVRKSTIKPPSKSELTITDLCSYYNKPTRRKIWYFTYSLFLPYWSRASQRLNQPFYDAVLSTRLQLTTDKLTV